MTEEQLQVYIDDPEIRIAVRKILDIIPPDAERRRRFIESFELARARAIVGKREDKLFDFRDVRLWTTLKKLMYSI